MGWIVILAAITSFIAFTVWIWIDRVVLPHHSGDYLKYSVMAGIAFAFSCLLAFIAFAISQGGERLIPVGITLSCVMGLIVSIGTAISYWIEIFPKHSKKEDRGDEN